MRFGLTVHRSSKRPSAPRPLGGEGGNSFEHTALEQQLAAMPVLRPCLVVGLDSSTPSWNAFAWSVGEVRRRGAELVVVHVLAQIGTGLAFAGSLSGMCYEMALRAKLETSDRLRNRAAVCADEAGVAFQFISVTGDVPGELLRVVQLVQGDVLAVGRSTKLLHHLAGSVGRRLANSAAAPIVVVVP